MRFDADVGGLPATLCREHELLPSVASSNDRTMTLVQKSLDPKKRELLSFMTGRPIEIRQLPNDPSVVAAFREVLGACANFHSALPHDTHISESADEALESIERGEQPQCCQRPELTEMQWQLMDEIRSKYELFLAAMDQAS